MAGLFGQEPYQCYTIRLDLAVGAKPDQMVCFDQVLNLYQLKKVEHTITDNMVAITMGGG